METIFKIIRLSSIALCISVICLSSCQSNNNELPITETEPKTPVEEVKPPVPIEEEPLDIPFIRRENIDLTVTEQQISGQANTFAFHLLKKVYADKEEKDKNILLSPLNATLAFCMVNNGAAGATGEEIRQTLGFGDVSSEDINIYAQKMVNAMQTLDLRGKFESANSIWIKNDFPVLEAFKKVNQQYYDAEIQNVDFTLPVTIQTINNWISEKTHEKIKEMLKEINPLTRLILCNTLYFKGYWTFPFDKKSTTDLAFQTSTGNTQMTPTMRQTLRTSLYTKLTNCSVLELAFGNGAFSLVVVLPDENSDIPAVLEQVDGNWWTQVISGLEGPPYLNEVKIEIPRFKLEYERTLNDDLQALGMKTPFIEWSADFSLINNRDSLFISLVKQKTFAEMNEKGLEAAAATAIMLDATCGVDEPVYTPVDFKVNRPFLYFIKEKSTSLVFFAGIMNSIH